MRDVGKKINTERSSNAGQSRRRFALLAGIASAFILSTALFSISYSATAQTLRVAVASNFSTTFKAIKRSYEKQTDHKLVELSGSSGKLFAQIYHGAPVDIFLAADSQRPERLEQQQLAVDNSRFTYAFGRLALWTSAVGINVDSSSLNQDFPHLAIANPDIAPYGTAAKQVLKNLGLENTFRNRLIRGESVSQAMHYVASENAQFGFVSLAQAQQLAGSHWLVPLSLHQPIEQQAIVIKQSEAASDFVDFLQSKQTKTLLQEAGYIAP